MLKADKRRHEEFVEAAKALILIFIAIYLVYVALKSLLPVLTPFIVGIFITYLLRPLYLFLRRKRIPKGLSILLTYVIFLVVFAILITIFIPVFIAQAKEFIQYIPRIQKSILGFINSFKSYLRQFSFAPQVESAVQRSLNEVSLKAVNILQSISMAGVSLFSFVINLILSLIISIYFLKDWAKISSTIKSFIRGMFGDEAVDFLSESNKKIAMFVKGQVLVAILTGLITGVVLYLLKVPLAGFIGILVSIFDLVPYFGPVFAGTLAVLLALSVSPVLALWTAIAIFIVQQLEAMFFSPLIVGKNTEIHPLTILFSLLLGATLFGFIGIMIAVPVAGIVKVWIEKNIIGRGGEVEER